MRMRGAVVGSLLVHGGLLAVFGQGLLRGPAKEPAPRVLRAEIPVEAPLEADAPPLQPVFPVAPDAPTPDPELVEALPPAPDFPVFDADEPPGPPSELIGVSSIDGRRRGVAGVVGGGGRIRGSGTGTGAGPAPVKAPDAEPAPVPDPVFLPPALKKDVPPVYPPAVRRKGIEGTVRVRVEVTAEGTVSAATVARSSGNEELDASAVEAAAAWLFEPATEDGRPVACVVYRAISFGLVGGK